MPERLRSSSYNPSVLCLALAKRAISVILGDGREVSFEAVDVDVNKRARSLKSSNGDSWNVISEGKKCSSCLEVDNRYAWSAFSKTGRTEVPCGGQFTLLLYLID